MSLLERLRENKGTVSSAPGKELAKLVIRGDSGIFYEVLSLIHSDDKNVGSGAAKIIEKVAEENLSLVSPHLPDLLECMDYCESQTRWMVLHIAGLCANLQPKLSGTFFNSAVMFLEKEHGTVLNDRAITYFGYMGAVSNEDCNRCFPYLIRAFELHPKRTTRVFESLLRMKDLMDDLQKQTLLKYAAQYSNSERSGIKKWTKTVYKEFIK
ncbi:MAG TPA: hypothetical protein VMW76_09655 [Bacteroidales bacterium]|nr:hypothetical protein [Bacteroidales bacterium]